MSMTEIELVVIKDELHDVERTLRKILNEPYDAFMIGFQAKNSKSCMCELLAIYDSSKGRVSYKIPVMDSGSSLKVTEVSKSLNTAQYKKRFMSEEAVNLGCQITRFMSVICDISADVKSVKLNYDNTLNIKLESGEKIRG